MRFENNEFQRALTSVLECADRGASDIGEVLETAARIEDGDADSWVLEWVATAGEVWARACDNARAGRRQSAFGCFHRAASYYAAALALISRSTERYRRLAVWRRQRDCWDRATELMRVPGERTTIPYEQTTLPAYFFASTGRGRQPLVIVNNGGHSCTSRMWARGGAAAAERGYHWMTFDGPGQQAALLEQGLVARPDWEAVLSPVIDAMSARPDVDPDRIGVLGVDQGGFLVARALAYEHRSAAAVADPGLVDLSARWKALLPADLRRLLTAGEFDAFDREFRIAALLSPALDTAVQEWTEPYGDANGSLARLLGAMQRYRLGAEVARIRTPLLVTDSAAGQARRLFDRVRGPKALIAEPATPTLRETQSFDWLDSWLVPA